jgi:5-methylcytosine-specific restriction enzyme subunit McrC
MTDCPLSNTEVNKQIAETVYSKYGKQISVDFPSPANDHHFVLRSDGNVGYFPVNDIASLSIQPREANPDNIFRMFEYAYNLGVFKIFEGESKVESVQDLFENLASILAKRVLDKNRKGLYRGYQELNEDITYVKGRAHIKDTYILLQRGLFQIRCDYEEHTADLEENQILLWALHQARRMDFKRSDVKDRVSLAYRELSSKISLKQMDVSKCLKRFYNRLNEDYKPLHGLCRFFIEQGGPGIQLGEYRFLAFSFYMPFLFESFVAGWLNEKLSERGYTVEPQFDVELDRDRLMRIRMDLVIYNKLGEVKAVLDTKYKHTDLPDQDDLGKIMLYAARVKTQNAILVYPSHITREYSPYTMLGVTMRSLVFDISKDLNSSGNEFLIVNYIV